MHVNKYTLIFKLACIFILKYVTSYLFISNMTNDYVDWKEIYKRIWLKINNNGFERNYILHVWNFCDAICSKCKVKSSGQIFLSTTQIMLRCVTNYCTCLYSNTILILGEKNVVGMWECDVNAISSLYI